MQSLYLMLPNTNIMTIIEKRHVPIVTYLKLLRNRRPPLGMIGFIFLSMAVFVLLPVSVVVNSNSTAPYENYDAEAIATNGVIKNAVIIALENVTNVNVNGNNPLLITYGYEDGRKNVTDKFQTLDREKTLTYSVGDTIIIKAYKGQSQIVELASFSFPYEIFLLFPVLFGSLGLIFFLIGFFPAQRIFKLYESGLVKNANVYSMVVERGHGRSIEKYLFINYRYTGVGGKQLSGTTITTDLSLMQEMRQNEEIKIFVSEIDESTSTVVPLKLAIKQGWRI